MAKNTSITLGNHFETLIENSIASGRYASASEVISAELRKIEEEEQKIMPWFISFRNCKTKAVEYYQIDIYIIVVPFFKKCYFLLSF